MLLIQFGNVAQELSKNERVLAHDGTGCRNGHGVEVEIRHAQVTQEQAAVGVRIGTHAAIALRRQLRQFGNETSVVVEQFLRFVALHPAFEQRHVLRMLLIDEERHLMGSRGPLDPQSVYDLRPGPALG